MENINSNTNRVEARPRGPAKEDIRLRKRRKAVKKENKLHIFLRNFSLFILLALCIVMAIRVIMNYTEISRLNNEISQLEEEIEIKESQRDSLSAELEPYKASSRIEKIAKLQLGMDYPDQSQIVEIDVSNSTDMTEIVEEEKGIVGTIISALRFDESNEINK